MTVTETFVALGVRDMARATAFYVGVFGAEVRFASPGWSSLFVAGVRIGLAADPAHRGGRSGLHFAVDDLAAACADVERAGGAIAQRPRELAPGLVIAEIADPEGNVVTLRG